MEKNKKAPKLPIHLFSCGSCKDMDAMGFEEFKHHLFTEHNLKADQLKGRKQMVMHMDMAESYSSTYNWTLETGLTFQEYQEHERAKDDPMRYEY